MRLADYRRHCELMADAIGKALRLLRPPGAACACCKRPFGTAHKTDCAAAPIIRARGAFRLAAEQPSAVPTTMPSGDQLFEAWLAMEEDETP